MFKIEKASNTDVSKDTENDLSNILSFLSTLPDNETDNQTPNLLLSLKPYLNPKRQKKLEQCEKIIMLTDTIKLLNDLNFFDTLINNTEE